jgi:hypothetical protein
MHDGFKNARITAEESGEDLVGPRAAVGATVFNSMRMPD